MIVSPASRMLSAISFGVLRRSAPSTSAIIRSRNDLPGSCVTSITSRSESSFVPPVTAERSPPDSRMTGADSPVIADSSTEPTPSMISPSAGITSPASTTTTSPRCSSAAGTSSTVARARRDRGRARRAQRVRLRLAAAFGDRLGEVREQHGQPEPDGDHADEPELSRVPAGEVEEEDPGRDHAAELDDEHHRVLQLQPRVELRERVPDRRERELAREDAGALRVPSTCLPLSRARLSSSTLTPGSPKKPQRAAVGVLARSAAATVASGRWRTAATRRACSCA